MRKVIITVAISGGLQSSDIAPYLPEQPEEIAQSAYECYEAGASVIHIHARDKEGNVTADPAIHRDINKLVRERCPDVIINNSTGVGPGYSFEERMGVLDAMPEAASFNMGTMVRTKFQPGSLFLNTQVQLEEMAKVMLEKEIKPEMEVFSQYMIVEAKHLIAKGLVKPPYWFNIVMGSSNMGTLPGTVDNLISMYQYLKDIPDSVITVTGIGYTQIPMTTMGCIMGSHVRVGMEDNLYLSKGVLAEKNAQFVSRTVEMIKGLQLEVATPQEARKMLGIEKIATY